MNPVTSFAVKGADASALARSRTQTIRRARILALHVAGLSQIDIARKLGVSARTIQRDCATFEEPLVFIDELLENEGLDGHDVHMTLTDMHDADLADIIVDPSVPITEIEYKPIEQWPAIWRRGLAGKIRITPINERSKDGVQAGESKSWDRTGYKVEIERESLLKILELSAKLKQVDALVKQNAIEVEQNIEINITWTTPEDKAAQDRIIDLTPERKQLGS